MNKELNLCLEVGHDLEYSDCENNMITWKCRRLDCVYNEIRYEDCGSGG